MPSTPTEAKHTPWRISLPTEKRQHTVLMFDAYGRLVASSSWHDSSPYYPTKAQSIDNFERIAAAVNERASLLSLIEDMAKALEAFSECCPEFEDQPDDLHVFLEWNDEGEPVQSLPVADFRRARSALSRYTEFLEQNNG